MRFVLVLLVFALLAFGSEVNDVAPFSQSRVVSGSGSELFLDEIDYIDLEVVGAGAYCVGVGFDGTYLWVTEGVNVGSSNQNQIFVINYETHALVGQYTQNETSGWGMRDLCCDGTYMFGSESNDVDYYDISTYEKVGAYTCTAVSPNRAQGWDGTNFYTGSFSADIYQVTWDGASGSTATSTLWSSAVANGGLYGLAWDYYNDCVWASTASGDYQLYQIDNAGALIAAHSYNIETAGGCTPGDHLTHPDQAQLWVLEQGSPDGLRCYELQPVSLEQETWGSIKTLF